MTHIVYITMFVFVIIALLVAIVLLLWTSINYYYRRIMHEYIKLGDIVTVFVHGNKVDGIFVRKSFNENSYIIRIDSKLHSFKLDDVYPKFSYNYKSHGSHSSS